MKRLLLLVFAALTMTTNQANTLQTPSHSFHKPLAGKKTSATRSVLALATPKHQRRFLIANNLIDDHHNDLPGPDELDLHNPYSRPRITGNRNDSNLENDISNYAVVRLAVARARALEKYREVWG